MGYRSHMKNLEVEIVRAIHRGADDAARSAFRMAVGTDTHAAEALIARLGRTVRLPNAAILCGPARLVWGNPFRTDHAWRCGVCPWTGSNYTSSRAANKAAWQHSTDDHQGAVLIQPATVT